MSVGESILPADESQVGKKIADPNPTRQNPARQDGARPDPDAWHVEWTDSTGSTNADLLQRAERGDLADRSVLRTDHQTAGRGRLDRRWDAPPGANLLASVYLRDASRAADLMHRFGLAIVGAIEAMVPMGDRELGLKWPNDILLDGRKLAGVLAQRSNTAPGMVVGFGVNLGWAPEGAAMVGDITRCTPADLLDRTLRCYDDLPTIIDDLYRQRLLTIGKRVRVHLPDQRVVVGRATGVDPTGRLLVETDEGDDAAFDVGDVVHLRTTE